MVTPEQNNDEVIIPHTRDEQGRRIYRATLTPTQDQRCKVLLAKVPAVIPVIVLPGIMGTNLKHKTTGKVVWRPPNTRLNFADVLGIVRTLFVWGRYDAKARQKILKAEDLVVDDRGPVDVGNSGLSEKAVKLRGWGKVSRMSYNPIMALMEERFDYMVKRRKVEEWWNEVGLRAPADYGEELGQVQALTEAELMKAGRFDFDVWCGGYNWLQSNRQSAEDIKRYIENTVLPYYRDQDDIGPEQVERMKVILVTHSMGGLAARALTELLGYDRILGVVHGVQPATGAPAIYHHMRCGYEGSSQIVLGRNAGEVTAVIANSPGALELCPSFDHRNGQGWLFVQDANGRPLRPPLPQTGDPYGEIYTNPAWYGLVPEQNTKYLDLSGDSKNHGKRDPREKFGRLIDDVAQFHRDFAGKYHPETYAHYGADDDEDLHSWRDVVWRGDPSALEAPSATPKDDGNGSYRGWWGAGRSAPEITKVEGTGDGTVSADSGAAPGQAGVKASFRQGSLGKGQHNNTSKGFSHQDSYNDARAQWTTLYSIVKIAQLADWHPLDEGQCSP